MLQIRNLIWGLLFIGCAGKTLCYLVFIWGYAAIKPSAVAKTNPLESRPSCAGLFGFFLNIFFKSHPLVPLAASIPVADSGQWRQVQAGALQRSAGLKQSKSFSVNSEVVLLGSAVNCEIPPGDAFDSVPRCWVHSFSMRIISPRCVAEHPRTLGGHAEARHCLVCAAILCVHPG